MIQRIQTVWLLLAVVAIVACLCLPLASIELPAEGCLMPSATLTNFCIVDDNGTRSFGLVTLLAVFLLVALPDAAMAITSFRNRKLQATLCLVGMADMVLWYALLAFQLLTVDGDGVSVDVWAALPLLAIVFFWLARRGILADEALVRAADRIR